MRFVRKRVKKWIRFAAAFALALVIGLPIFSATPSRVSAIEYTETTNEYDSTSVAEDLGDSVMTQLENTGGSEIKLYSFMEYCYSNSVDILNTKYGLYVYIFNPERKEFSRQLGANVVNMAVSYAEGGAPNSYSNLMLKYCGNSTGKYDKLVYKYRVMGLNAVVENALVQNAEDGERRYDVAGVQLLEVGTLNAVDYGISRTFFYSGYAAGCGSEESTLECRNVELETVRLDVKHTNYRTGTYNYEHICDELHTAYFAVDEKFFTNYGGLQKIKAEWYEYKTKPIFVTSDSDAYTALYDYIGKDIGTNWGEHIDGLKWRVVWEENEGDSAALYKAFDASYNVDKDFSAKIGITTTGKTKVSCIDWLLERPGATSKNDYVVSREDLINYMTATYLAKYPNAAKLLGKYPSALFADSIDEDRLELLQDPTQKSGYVKPQEIDAGSKIDLLYADKSTDTKLGEWLYKWLGIRSISYDVEQISPIVVLDGSANLRSMTTETFASLYYINPLDAEEVYNYCLEQIDAGRRAVLFRFAKTDYYSSNARFDIDGGFSDTGSGLSDEDGYVAQETVFLDFDIISLTFRKVNVDTVIACVSDPIDIIGALEAEREMEKEGLNDSSSNGCASVKKIFGIVVLVLVLVVIVKLVLWIKKKFNKKE